LEEIACLINVGGPDLAAVERSMRLFAERVMPYFATGRPKAEPVKEREEHYE
jgi:hypothetical protein